MFNQLPYISLAKYSNWMKIYVYWWKDQILIEAGQRRVIERVEAG